MIIVNKIILNYLKCKYKDDLKVRFFDDRDEKVRKRLAAYKSILYLKNFCNIPKDHWKHYLLDLGVDEFTINNVLAKVKNKKDFL